MKVEEKVDELNSSVKVALGFMLDHFQDDINLDRIANSIGVNKFHLCRLFKTNLSTGPVSWLWKFRTFLSAEIIYQRPLYSLGIVRSLCGFKHACHFTRLFKEQLKVRPSAFRKYTLGQNKHKSSGVFYNSPYNQEIINIAFQKTMYSIQSALFDKNGQIKRAEDQTNSHLIRL